ncbi:pirin-like C-terminal cupin domain-containing protein [Bacteriovorax sp. PP10]|uniref:Pirin-like C-terminal cupin domain-containing protein n=1 Tax=Bacteriovorax antarcticus TaxID=3088717 RepID=A0ABU5VZA1_9BACT|nr:pirin-like C-terminal cupin domain-containing protein [Bacteriovorax sp. PP10]MEA9358398.1 pirin-like C-terminal cupin domain-containing protein [Bacteriovorax sp. PP10]
MDIITVVYSSDLDLEDVNSKRDKNGLTKKDIEWMRSDCGVLQDGEYVSKEISKTFQLWLCLPDNIDPLKYNNLTKMPVPLIQLPKNAGKARIIAGAYGKEKGPIEAESLECWDMRLNPKRTVELKVIKNQNAALFVISGEIVLSDGNQLGPAELGILDYEGSFLSITAITHTKVVFLSGPNINEPIIGYGKFELESVEKIRYN